MTSNIILSTDEAVVCPNCAKNFPIEQIQSIAQNLLPELDKILQLLLPGESES